MRKLLLQGALLCTLACAPVSPLRRATPPPQPDGEEPQLEQARTLRVLLQRGARGLRVSARGGLRLLHPSGRQVLLELGPGSKAKLRALDGRLHSGADDLEVQEALLEARVAGQQPLVAGRPYRGRLLLRASGSDLYLLNQVGLEEYLYGVLPSEVPGDWPLEALKAQAVAARTYALWRAEQGGSPHWDLDDSTASQAYLGRQKEHARTCQAVDHTAAEVLTYAGRLAQAFFHSNSGGYTADVADVWGSALPYLGGVSDPWSEGQQHYAWSGVVPKAEVARLLARAGHWRGALEDLRTLERDDSGRCLAVRLSGGGREARLRCTSLRAALGSDLIRSTIFKVQSRAAAFHFEGLGWGHGVGLAQEGARAMADHGHGYRRILSHYYPGTTLKRVN